MDASESLPTRGAWIEILLPVIASQTSIPSLPTRGAWIEIFWRSIVQILLRSLPTRGAWIEMPRTWVTKAIISSLPTRGAWIEIQDRHSDQDCHHVAPHKGSVD